MIYVGASEPPPCCIIDCYQSSVALCDSVIDGKDFRCGLPMCQRHRHEVGDGQDICPAHWQWRLESSVAPFAEPVDG